MAASVGAGAAAHGRAAWAIAAARWRGGRSPTRAPCSCRTSLDAPWIGAHIGTRCRAANGSPRDARRGRTGDNRLQAGLVVDDWTETVPERAKRPASSFHFNRPNAVAPQALLVVVPPVLRGHWEWDDLVGLRANEALDLAKLRAVEPEPGGRRANERPPFGSYFQLLPAILSEFTAARAADDRFRRASAPKRFQTRLMAVMPIAERRRTRVQLTLAPRATPARARMEPSRRPAAQRGLRAQPARRGARSAVVPDPAMATRRVRRRGRRIADRARMAYRRHATLDCYTTGRRRPYDATSPRSAGRARSRAVRPDAAHAVGRVFERLLATDGVDAATATTSGISRSSFDTRHRRRSRPGRRRAVRVPGSGHLFDAARLVAAVRDGVACFSDADFSGLTSPESAEARGCGQARCSAGFTNVRATAGARPRRGSRNARLWIWLHRRPGGAPARRRRSSRRRTRFGTRSTSSASIGSAPPADGRRSRTGDDAFVPPGGDPILRHAESAPLGNRGFPHGLRSPRRQRQRSCPAAARRVHAALRTTGACCRSSFSRQLHAHRRTHRHRRIRRSDLRRGRRIGGRRHRVAAVVDVPLERRRRVEHRVAAQRHRIDGEVEAPALEQVLFLRDEMANMVWAARASHQRRKRAEPLGSQRSATWDRNPPASATGGPRCTCSAKRSSASASVRPGARAWNGAQHFACSVRGLPDQASSLSAPAARRSRAPFCVAEEEVRRAGRRIARGSSGRAGSTGTSFLWIRARGTVRPRQRDRAGSCSMQSRNDGNDETEAAAAAKRRSVYLLLRRHSRQSGVSVRHHHEPLTDCCATRRNRRIGRPDPVDDQLPCGRTPCPAILIGRCGRVRSRYADGGNKRHTDICRPQA